MSTRGRPYGRVAIGLASLIGSMAVVVGVSAPATADAAGKGGDFVALSPSAAVLDTRNGTGGVTGVRGPASTTSFPVLGVGGIPASGVSAVLVDATVVNSSAATFFTLFPDGATRPADVTMVHANANQVISNSAVVPVGSNGRISLYNNAGNAHAVVDVQGYFTSQQTTSGGGYVPVPHNWLTWGPGGPGGQPPPPTASAIPANGSQTITVTGGTVPAGASALFVNIMVVDALAAGWLAAYPAGGTGPRSVMDFPTGTSSGGATLKLPADGQVTFANHSSQMLQVKVKVSGYATATSTTGAGFRKVTADRLLDTRVGGGSGLGAGQTLPIQVGGTNGLPTRGIAGAVLNITTISTTAGSLVIPRVCEEFCVPEQPEAPFIMAIPSGTTRSALVFAPLNGLGQLRLSLQTLVHPPPAPVHLLVDLEGWFASPLPALPPTSYAPTVAMQGVPSGTALAPVTYSYVDNIGTVRIGHQSSLDDFNTVQWTPISGQDAFAGRPALSQLSDNRVQVAAQNADSDIWTSSQVSANGTTWNPFTDLGGSMAAPPTAARLSDGTTVLFAVGTNGGLWHLRSADDGWRVLDESAALAGTVAVGPIQDGLRLFALNAAGSVKTATYGTDGFLSSWTDLGGAGSTGTPAVVVAPGFRARVVVRAADGSLATKFQDASLAFPTSWSPVGTFTAAGSPAAILDPILNRVAVVARGTDNEVYRSFETAQGSGVFGEWLQLNPDVSDPAASDPTVAPVTNTSGQTWIVVFRNLNDGNRVYVREQLTPSAAQAQQTSEFVGHTLPAPPA